MTLNQATKRLEKLTIALDGLRGRIEALTKDMSAEATTAKPRAVKTAKAPKSNGQRTQRPSPIGASINYGGLQGKVVERKGSKFAAEMSDGKRRWVSAVYVYRQLGKKKGPTEQQVAKAAAVLQKELESPAMAAALQAPVPTTAPQVTHDTSVAEDVANTVIEQQLAEQAAAPTPAPVVERAQKSRKQKVA